MSQSLIYLDTPHVCGATQQEVGGHDFLALGNLHSSMFHCVVFTFTRAVSFLVPHVDTETCRKLRAVEAEQHQKVVQKVVQRFMYPVQGGFLHLLSRSIWNEEHLIGGVTQTVDVAPLAPVQVNQSFALTRPYVHAVICE